MITNSSTGSFEGGDKKLLIEKENSSVLAALKRLLAVTETALTSPAHAMADLTFYNMKNVLLK